ncbi:MAG: septal ring lytic transglycosylase RlpA family protein [Thermodesulfobacteriota bacterium]|nr:septal ring lytic transglycosylase RlpA family protein [Thermodesulfobacteriota bacterium]
MTSDVVYSFRPLTSVHISPIIPAMGKASPQRRKGRIFSPQRRKGRREHILNSKFFYLCILYVSMVTFFTACATAPRYQYSRGITRDTKGIPPTQRPYEIFGEVYYPIPSAGGFAEEGKASWYGPDFHGKCTSCGEIYDMYEFTAAHKLLPMHTYVRVLNLENNRETVVRINDRGPFVKGRVIDLSLVAAREIGIHNNGTAFVRVEALGTPTEVSENGRRVKRFVQTMDYRAGNFWIQVGAFTNKDNADRMRATLNRNYGQVDIEAHNRGDALFYRVQVFASTNLDKARDIQQQFESNGFPGAFLVAR